MDPRYLLVHLDPWVIRLDIPLAKPPLAPPSSTLLHPHDEHALRESGNTIEPVLWSFQRVDERDLRVW